MSNTVFVPSMILNNKTYQIFQVITSERDGSIYITFPYYKYKKGLVSLVRFPKGSREVKNLSLIDKGSKGKITSHRVKVSHHISGQANFSLTGKVFTIIKKQSVELNKSSGHLFTIQFQGLEDFKELKANKKNHIYKSFDIGDKKNNAFKIVGFWYSPDEFKKRLKDIDYNDLKDNYEAIKYNTPNGSKGTMYFIRSDCKLVKDYYLCLYCRGLKDIDKNNYSTLTFLGGFDDPDIINNLNLNTYFIAMVYPVDNYEELREKLGTIDIIEKI